MYKAQINNLKKEVQDRDKEIKKATTQHDTNMKELQYRIQNL